VRYLVELRDGRSSTLTPVDGGAAALTPVSNTCPAGHILSEFECPADYSCDNCAETMPTGTTLWGCRQCDFDMCVTCRQARAEAPEEPELVEEGVVIRASRRKRVLHEDFEGDGETQDAETQGVDSGSAPPLPGSPTHVSTNCGALEALDESGSLPAALVEEPPPDEEMSPCGAEPATVVESHCGEEHALPPDTEVEPAPEGPLAEKAPTQDAEAKPEQDEQTLSVASGAACQNIPAPSEPNCTPSEPAYQTVPEKSRGLDLLKVKATSKLPAWVLKLQAAGLSKSAVDGNAETKACINEPGIRIEEEDGNYRAACTSGVASVPTVGPWRKTAATARSDGDAMQAAQNGEAAQNAEAVVEPKAKKIDLQKEQRKQKQALLLDMFKSSLPCALEASAAVAAGTGDAPRLRLRSVAPEALSPQKHQVELEERDGSYRACYTSEAEGLTGPALLSKGPWRTSPEEATEDGEVMEASRGDLGSPANGVPEVWADALEGAFPALRRLRRLSAGITEDGAEESEEEVDEEEADEEVEEDTEEEDNEEVALSAEFVRNHRKMLRDKRRQSRKLDRKLRWELSDIAEIRDEVEKMVQLGTATMSAEDQLRWQQVVDAAFAAPIDASLPVIGAQPPAGPQARPASSATSRPLFCSRGEDDGGQAYSLQGTKPLSAPRGSFLKAGLAPQSREEPEGGEPIGVPAPRATFLTNTMRASFLTQKVLPMGAPSLRSYQVAMSKK